MHVIHEAVTTLSVTLLVGTISAVLAVVNQIDMRNVSGYASTPACVQDCLYCCHDVAWQSACYTNECLCLASQFGNRLDYVEYCVSEQCDGNVDDVLAATSILKSYCLSSLWTSIYPVLTDAAATEPTRAIEVTVPSGFVFEVPSSVGTVETTPPTALQTTTPLGSIPSSQSDTGNSAIPTSTAGVGAGMSGSAINFNFTTFNGRSLLTGICGTPTFTTVRTTPGAFTAEVLPFVGCLRERLSCCPFPGSPEGEPYLDLPPSSQELSECPQDYSTIGSGCCPSGFSIYDIAISSGGPTPCFSSLSSPYTYSTTAGASANDPVITDEVFALSLPLQPHRGLSTGAKAGIGLGAAIGGIGFLSAMLFLWWARRTGSKSSPSKTGDVYKTTDQSELGGQQVSEAPDNSVHVVAGHVSSTYTQEQSLAELYGDRRIDPQELAGVGDPVMG